MDDLAVRNTDKAETLGLSKHPSRNRRRTDDPPEDLPPWWVGLVVLWIFASTIGALVWFF